MRNQGRGFADPEFSGGNRYKSLNGDRADKNFIHVPPETSHKDRARISPNKWCGGSQQMEFGKRSPKRYKRCRMAG